MHDMPKKSVAARYSQLESHRHAFLERARDAAESTIPTYAAFWTQWGYCV